MIPWCGAALLGLRASPQAQRAAAGMAGGAGLGGLQRPGGAAPVDRARAPFAVAAIPVQGPQPLRLALVADVAYRPVHARGWQIRRLVDQLNALDVDAVVVASDWT